MINEDGVMMYKINGKENEMNVDATAGGGAKGRMVTEAVN